MRLLTAVVFFLSSVVAAQIPPPPPPPPAPPQGQQPRDLQRQPEATGTAIIRGRVIAGDTGTPVRRANVSLSPMGPPSPVGGIQATAAGTSTTTRSVIVNGVATPMTSSVGFVGAARPRTATTDAQGAFEFTGLPAGSYRIMASAGQYSAAYLGIAYGAKKPSAPGSFDPGTPIELADGQRFDKATIALPRGAVITGRVSDDSGEPMARVQVYPMFFPPGSARGQRMGMSAQTDDLGQFRLFGLTPGEYVVVAEARGPTFVPPNAPVESEEDKIGFITSYYPATADEAAAQRVRVRAAAETAGIDIRMVTGRLFRISGTVTDSQGRASARTSGSLFRGTSGSMSSFGFSTDEQGRFQMRNIPPGSYRLLVRGRPSGMEGPQNEPGEMASMPLTVNSDLEGLLVMTAPGATITGQVVFEQGPPAEAGSSSLQMRVSAMAGDPQNMMGVSPPQPALVTPDLTFTLKGMTGEFLLRASAPGQFLKAVMIGAEDITDTPRDFKTGDRVTIVLTSRASTLEGTVTDAKGVAVADAALIAFSEDKAAWRANAVRTRRAVVDQNGHYRITGMLPGRYYIVAMPRDRSNVLSMNQDTAYFEQLAKEATSFVIGEDEQRQVDLKVSGDAGGDAGGH